MEKKKKHLVVQREGAYPTAAALRSIALEMKAQTSKFLLLLYLIGIKLKEDNPSFHVGQSRSPL